MTSSDVWSSFTVDPRRPAAAGLRASDGDRDVVLAVLAEGYAEGRLDKQEYDERSASTAARKTLGELSGLIVDLVPDHAPSSGSDLAFASPGDLRAQALRRWESQRRSALSGFLMPSLICWVIWVLVNVNNHGASLFPWPVFVMLGTGANLGRVLTRKEEIVAEEVARLARKQRKAIESRRRDQP